MRTMLRGKVTLLFMMLGMLLALPAVAYAADGIIADGDTVTAGDQASRDLGTVGPGNTVTPDPNINFYLDCNGQNHFNSNEQATIAYNNAGSSIKDADGNPVTTSGSLNATSLTNISGPTSWPADGTGCGTTANALLGSSAVTIVAPDDPGTYTYTVAYTVTRGTGTASNELDTVVTNLPVTFTLTVEETDDTPPVITPNVVGTLGNNGWYTSDVNLTWSVVDDESDISSQSGCDDVSVTSDQNAVEYTCSATSAGGTSSETVTIKRDATAPTNVAFVGGGLTDGASYDFGSVPAGPTSCTADGAISGLKSPNGCVLSGYSAAVGPQAVTATAEDNAGNTSTKTLSYTVAAATAKGFYSPVDMGNVTNTVKGGSTVPLKFELFGGASNTEQKALSAVSSVSAKQITCGTTPGSSDAIEEIVSTNATGLRFDTTGDQFIYNWKTPKSPGTCYLVTMTAADQQTKLLAYFKLS